MKSLVFKRSIVVGGHKTSVSLEDAFWNGLKEIAGERHMNLSEVVAEIDAQRQHGNLSAALRLFVLDFYRTQLSHGSRLHGRAATAARPSALAVRQLKQLDAGQRLRPAGRP